MGLGIGLGLGLVTCPLIPAPSPNPNNATPTLQPQPCNQAWKDDAAAAEEQAREDLAIEGFALHTSSKVT